MRNKIDWFVSASKNSFTWFLIPTIGIYKDWGYLKISLLWLIFDITITRYDREAVPF